MKLWRKWIEKIRKRDENVGYTCDACGCEIFAYPSARLCEKCIEELPLNDGCACEKCGRTSVTVGVCLDCKRTLPKFTQGVSAFVYSGKIASLINAMKSGKRRLAAFFGEQAANAFYEKFQSELLGEHATEWLIIPVPLTDLTRKKRGYNQAAEMAKSVERQLQSLGVKAAIDESVLEKKRDTPSQKRLSFLESILCLFTRRVQKSLVTVTL